MRARDNPYRVQRMHALAFRFRATSWDQLWERLRRLKMRACVLGPHGSGKTTLLGELSQFLRGRGLPVRYQAVRAADIVSRQQLSHWSTSVRDRAVLIVDGADLLSLTQWRFLKRETRDAAGLIVSSHGKRLLPVLYACRTTPDLLESLMRELHPTKGCGQPTPIELFARHQGDLREALRELYDFHARSSGAH